MKLKFVLASILLFGAVSTSFAQSDDSDEEIVVAAPDESYDENLGFGGKHSCVKTDFNCGWNLRDESDGYVRGGFGPGYSICYEYIFKHTAGLGFVYIEDHGNKANFKTYFTGPTFVYAKSRNSWTFDFSSGIGAAGIHYNSPRRGRVHADGPILGIMAQTEIQKRFSKHFGIAAGVRVIAASLFAMDIWEEDEAESTTWSTASVRFTIGPRFYF